MSATPLSKPSASCVLIAAVCLSLLSLAASQILQQGNFFPAGFQIGELPSEIVCNESVSGFMHFSDGVARLCNGESWISLAGTSQQASSVDVVNAVAFLGSNLYCNDGGEFSIVNRSCECFDDSRGHLTGPQCTECLGGWEATDSSDSKCLQDIDECSLNLHDCQSFAVCENVPGSFECRCPDGYGGNASTSCTPCPTGTAGTGGHCYQCPDGTEAAGDRTHCSACRDDSVGVTGGMGGCAAGLVLIPNRDICIDQMGRSGPSSDTGASGCDLLQTKCTSIGMRVCSRNEYEDSYSDGAYEALGMYEEEAGGEHHTYGVAFDTDSQCTGTGNHYLMRGFTGEGWSGSASGDAQGCHAKCCCSVTGHHRYVRCCASAPSLSLSGYAGTGGVCIQCGDGEMPGENRTECIQCPEGWAGTGGTCTRQCLDGWQSLSPRTDCEHCPHPLVGTGGVCEESCGDGYRRNYGRTACEACPAGTAGTGGLCSACPPGTSPSLSRTQCLPCGEREISPAGEECTVCPDGYRPNPAKSECEECPETYAGVNGTCSQCPDGFSPSGDRSQCIQCVVENECTQEGMVRIAGTDRCIDTVGISGLDTSSTAGSTCDFFDTECSSRGLQVCSYYEYAAAYTDYSFHNFTEQIEGSETHQYGYTRTACSTGDHVLMNGFEGTVWGCHSRCCCSRPNKRYYRCCEKPTLRGYAGTGGQCLQCPDGYQPTSDRLSCEPCPEGYVGTGGTCTQHCGTYTSPTNPSQVLESWPNTLRTQCRTCPWGMRRIPGTEECMDVVGSSGPSGTGDASSCNTVKAQCPNRGYSLCSQTQYETAFAHYANLSFSEEEADGLEHRYFVTSTSCSGGDHILMSGTAGAVWGCHSNCCCSRNSHHRAYRCCTSSIALD